MSDLFNIGLTRIDGSETTMAEYRGKTLLVVNTASECGYTPQYEGLEKLYREFKGKGLVVLGFPSDDFGGQEPGDNAQIRAFCDETFGVTFVFATHDPKVLDHARRIVRLEDGRIVEDVRK